MRSAVTITFYNEINERCEVVAEHVGGGSVRLQVKRRKAAALQDPDRIDAVMQGTEARAVIAALAEVMKD